MLKVTCNICAEQGKTTELSSKVIARDEKEGMQNIAQEMAKHLELAHGKEIVSRIVTPVIETQALLAMLCFSSEDEGFNEETERVRDSVLKAVTVGMDEDYDDDEDEDPEEEEEEDEEEGIDGLEQ